MKRSEAKKYRDKVVQAERLEQLGGMSETIEQSDKIGYDWHCFRIGDVIVNREYVKQENPIGTKDNPFEWEKGMSLVLNGFYSYKGKRYVAIADGNPTTIDENYLVEF